ncbi:MAG: energy-coupling factor transporter transmembrane component T [Methanocella sp.]
MKIPAIAKLAGLAVFSVAVLIAQGYMLAALTIVPIIAALILGANAGRLMRMLLPALPFIVIISAFQWLFAGPSMAVLTLSRITLLYVAGSIVTATTTETEFIVAIEQLLQPVSIVTRTNIGRDIATMMMLSIAFLPITKEEHDAIRLAQEARGVSYAGFRGLIRGEVAVIVPLIYGLSARADRVATAMEARCYGYKK